LIMYLGIAILAGVQMLAGPRSFCTVADHYSEKRP